MLITAIQPLIHTILVRYENIRVVTCEGHPRNFFQDNKGCTSDVNYNDRNIQVIARNPDPAVLDICPHNLVVQKTNYKFRAINIGKMTLKNTYGVIVSLQSTKREPKTILSPSTIGATVFRNATLFRPLRMALKLEFIAITP
ncbi:hypothetical protein EDB82DRAFT_485453 [Fusarium venenatum]|uniref:uncharacterized protein n=1 Tax=Fusarium venenatum TaxID=56646 RepID=UPI001D837B3F|nr:hypothetical protein EDB82DRAFT_485453 [Fusarium venenatum]